MKDMRLAAILLCALPLALQGETAKHAPGPHPPPVVPGLQLSNGFSDKLVLQSGKIASVYGMGSPAGAEVTVALTHQDEGTESYKTFVRSDLTWKVLVPPHTASQIGSTYTMGVSCPSCKDSNHKPSVSLTVNEVVFGDVWLCGGQSNMWLPMRHTFSRNKTMERFEAGHYHNIRFMIQPHADADTPMFTAKQNTKTNDGATASWVIANDTWTHRHNVVYHDPWLWEIGGACWYFAQSLVDEHGHDQYIGLLASYVGGTTVELWAPNGTINAKCSNFNCCWTHPDDITPTPALPQKPEPAEPVHEPEDRRWPGMDPTGMVKRLGERGGISVEGKPFNNTICGHLFNGMIAPFVNMTVKGFLWYQGENDIGRRVSGNVNPAEGGGTGYACAMQALIEGWRKYFSAEAGTTDADAPFGVVTLASQTSEGNEEEMGRFRWGQIGNHFVAPNADMPNVFVAQAYDIGDPFHNCAKPPKESAPCRPGTGPPGPCWCQDKQHCDPEDNDPPYSFNGTAWYMGPIHPRPKIYVGKRLAAAANALVYGGSNSWTGPVMSGCEVTADGNHLLVYFNRTFLDDQNDKIVVHPYTGQPYFGNFSSAFKVSDGSTYLGKHNFTYLHWVNAPTVKMKDNYSIEVDLSDIAHGGSHGLNGRIVNVAYAWEDRPCCGNNNRAAHFCPPESCPLKSGDGLPATPFYANITREGKCLCTAPAVCNETHL